MSLPHVDPPDLPELLERLQELLEENRTLREQLGEGLDERMVWVFGSPRTGTSWLLRMVQGPRIHVWNEPPSNTH